MLSSPLGLILGAGSSLDFGSNPKKPFPLGDDLRETLASKLYIETDSLGREVKRGSHSIYAAYRFASKDLADQSLQTGNLVGGGQSVARALPGCDSIDDLLERHTGNLSYEIPAKLGICESILDAERNSPIRRDPNRIEIPEIDRYSRHWLSAFLGNISRRCSKDNLGETFSNLNVINFNYDRCFEWFTFLWLRWVYGLDDLRAYEILRQITVIHPYGSLGVISGRDGSGIPFGYEPSPQELFQISKGIRTYSESISEDNRPHRIRTALYGCEKIIFMGFAFHQQNMDLMNLGEPHQSKAIYTTKVKMPTPKWEMAQTRICNSIGIPRSLLNVASTSESCEDLVNQYGDRWTD